MKRFENKLLDSRLYLAKSEDSKKSNTSYNKLFFRLICIILFVFVIVWSYVAGEVPQGLFQFVTFSFNFSLKIGAALSILT